MLKLVFLKVYKKFLKRELERERTKMISSFLFLFDTFIIEE